MNGRGERIRTSGLYVPNVALYQAKLHPDKPEGFTIVGLPKTALKLSRTPFLKSVRQL